MHRISRATMLSLACIPGPYALVSRMQAQRIRTSRGVRRHQHLAGGLGRAVRGQRVERALPRRSGGAVIGPVTALVDANASELTPAARPASRIVFVPTTLVRKVRSGSWTTVQHRRDGGQVDDRVDATVESRAPTASGSAMSPITISISGSGCGLQVDDAYASADADQFGNHVAADEARAAGHQDPPVVEIVIGHLVSARG